MHLSIVLSCLLILFLSSSTLLWDSYVSIYTRLQMFNLTYYFPEDSKTVSSPSFPLYSSFFLTQFNQVRSMVREEGEI